MAEGGSVFKMFERALGQAELFGDSPGEFTQGLALAGHYAANLFAGRANMIPESGDSSTVGDAGLKTLDDLFERLAQIRARARLCALPYDFDRLAGHLVAPRAQQAGFVANFLNHPAPPPRRPLGRAARAAGRLRGNLGRRRGGAGGRPARPDIGRRDKRRST